MSDKFFGHFFCRDNISICDAADDTNHDYHLWSGIVEFKDTTYQEIMNEICLATVFVKIYTIKIDILFVCYAKLCYTPDILSYIFCHIVMKNTDIFTICSVIRNTNLRHILGVYASASANGRWTRSISNITPLMNFFF